MWFKIVHAQLFIDLCVWRVGIHKVTQRRVSETPLFKVLTNQKLLIVREKKILQREGCILSRNSGHLIGWITWLCSKIIFLNEFLHDSYSLLFLLRPHKFLVIFSTHHMMNFAIFLANTNIFLTMRYQRCFKTIYFLRQCIFFDTLTLTEERKPLLLLPL